MISRIIKHILIFVFTVLGVMATAQYNYLLTAICLFVVIYCILDCDN